MVDAIIGAQETGGVSNGAENGTSGTSPIAVTLTGVTLDSWLYTGSCDETGAQTPVTDTLEKFEVTGSSSTRVGVNETGTSGNISVGWSTSPIFSSVTALEILASTGVFNSQDDDVTTSDRIGIFKGYVPYTFFQQNVFQENAFAILGGSTGPAGAFSQTVTDAAYASDSLGIVNALTVGFAQTENAVANDSETWRLAAAYPVTDGIRANDSENWALAAKASITDAAYAQDDLDYGLAPRVSVTENAVANDAEAWTLAAQYSITDTAVASEAQDVFVQTSTGAFGDTLTDNAVANDSEGWALQAKASVTDNAVINDTGAVGVGSRVSVTDACNTSDALAFALAAAYSERDNAVVSDSVLSAKAMASALSDAAYANDALGVALGLNNAASLQDSALASDAFAHALGSASINVSIADAAFASDALGVARGSSSINQTFKVWSGAAWVYWDGGGWV
jgi:hypothetical protein